MARLEKISNTSWKQPFTDRGKHFYLWGSQSNVADHCKLIDGTKRLLRIQFESEHEINVTDWFQITSGREIRFPKNFQELVKPIILANRDSYFWVRVLDVDTDEEESEPPSTTGTATIQTRIGQAHYRSTLIDYWKGCAVTGVRIMEILKASHIKPWSKSTDQERLDKSTTTLIKRGLLFDL